MALEQQHRIFSLSNGFKENDSTFLSRSVPVTTCRHRDSICRFISGDRKCFIFWFRYALNRSCTDSNKTLLYQTFYRARYGNADLQAGYRSKAERLRSQFSIIADKAYALTVVPIFPFLQSLYQCKNERTVIFKETGKLLGIRIFELPASGWKKYLGKQLKRMQNEHLFWKKMLRDNISTQFQFFLAFPETFVATHVLRTYKKHKIDGKWYRMLDKDFFYSQYTAKAQRFPSYPLNECVNCSSVLWPFFFVLIIITVGIRMRCEFQIRNPKLIIVLPFCRVRLRLFPFQFQPKTCNKCESKKNAKLRKRNMNLLRCRTMRNCSAKQPSPVRTKRNDVENVLFPTIPILAKHHVGEAQKTQQLWNPEQTFVIEFDLVRICLQTCHIYIMQCLYYYCVFECGCVDRCV